MIVKLGRTLWFYWGGLVAYGFKPGRTFGFAFLPRPERAPEGCITPSLARMDGEIGLFFIRMRWLFG